ncbi:MAG: hypothetical protein AAF502_20950 [Bacteroidota bacterium]
MKKIKGLILFFALLGLIFTSCSKDDQAPVIVNFKVNNTVTSGAAGDHAVGETVDFEFEATDDTELGAYQVKNESAGSTLLVSGALSGQAATVTFSLTIDGNDYSAGDDILLSFIVEDDRGSSSVRSYNIDVQ